VIPTSACVEEVCLPDLVRPLSDLDIHQDWAAHPSRLGEQQRFGFRPPVCSIHRASCVLDEAPAHWMSPPKSTSTPCSPSGEIAL